MVPVIRSEQNTCVSSNPKFLVIKKVCSGCAKIKEFKQFYVVSETMYGVKTKIIVADFSKGQFVYEDIERELRDIPVGVLGQYPS